MSVECKNIINYMNEIAPENFAQEWDNVGLLVGDKNSFVKKILVALDATNNVIDEAIQLKVDLIITHHPIIFKKLNNVTDDTLGGKILKLIRNNISVYSAHTNFDVAFGGTNDILCEKLNIKNIELLETEFTIQSKEHGIGRIGLLDTEITFLDYAKFVKQKLKLKNMNIIGNINNKINKVAVCTGDGRQYLKSAIKKGADLYISGDVKYHDAQIIQETNMCCIDVTHYQSENIAMPVLKKYLDKKSILEKWDLEIFISNIDGQPFVSI